MSKISIRFYKDHKVRAVWDEEHNYWWFLLWQAFHRAKHLAIDIVGVINQQDDHEKNCKDGQTLDAVYRKQLE